MRAVKLLQLLMRVVLHNSRKTVIAVVVGIRCSIRFILECFYCRLFQSVNWNFIGIRKHVLLYATLSVPSHIPHLWVASLSPISIRSVLLETWIEFCLTGPISLCLDSFLCMYYFVSDCVLHACVLCSIVTWWGGPGGIEAWSLGPLLPSVLWHCWLGHLTLKTCPRYDL